MNATDKDFGENSKIEYIISSTALYKLGSTKLPGSLVPSPFGKNFSFKMNRFVKLINFKNKSFQLFQLMVE